MLDITADADPRLLHGTGRLACDCWRCEQHRPWPPSTRMFVPKWSIVPLMAKGVTLDEVRELVGTERLIAWRNSGLPDHEADLAAVTLAHYHPAAVWRGWYAAAVHYWPDGGETHESNDPKPADPRRPR